MIFIVKDEHNEARDITIAKHIMNVHTKAGESTAEVAEGELSLKMIKKFVAYCRGHCGPRLSLVAGETLKKSFVLMRSGAHEHELNSDKHLSIPITGKSYDL